MEEQISLAKLHVALFYVSPNGRVPDFGGQLLDTDLNSGPYWQFCGTIIGVRTKRNPYKRDMQHHLIQRPGAMDGFHLKSYYS